MFKAKWKSEPITISPNVWFYRNETNITLVVEIRDGADNYVRTDQFKIPFRKLLGKSAGRDGR